ncbi:MAG TPA: hypothetical protein VLG28_00975, partial [Acidimicrobiia bacterium]|nr:hypothetical protein [Acidimicrobiia bacterium]
ANRTARTLNIWETAAWRVEDFSDTYYFEDPHIVDLGSAEIPDDIRSAITPGAAAIVYTEGAGERTLVDQKSGDLQDTFPAYGPRVALAVLVRTVAGWRVFYTDTSYAD